MAIELNTISERLARQCGNAFDDVWHVMRYKIFALSQ